jgi:hypothetical protein
MPRKMRHSKFKNTGILFELLTRQITADIIAGNEDSQAKDLLFSSILRKTPNLLKNGDFITLFSTKRLKIYTHAERFLSVIIEQRKKLSNTQAF